MRREPILYYVLRQIWHDECVKDALALVALGILIGAILAWRG